MAQGISSKAAIAKASLADSLEHFLKSAEEKKTEIGSKIDLLIQIANTRRQVLLQEIENEIELIQEDVRKKQISLSQLEKTEADIENNLSGNQARNAMKLELCKQINRIDLHLPNLKIKWSNEFTRIIEMFDLFCQLLVYTESPFELENNTAPIWTANLSCGSGTNEIAEAKSVAIDPETQSIYVGDANAMKILIFNMCGDFERSIVIKKAPATFGRMIIHNSSIYCYVNSSIFSTKLYKLNKTTGELIAELETGHLIRGLAISLVDNTLYTCRKSSERILRFSTDLVALNPIELVSPYIRRYRFMHTEIHDMLLLDGQIIALMSYTDYPIQVFDASGYLSRCVYLEKHSVLGEQFLCIDRHWNIIVTCCGDKFISVYNREGKRIAKVGKVGQEREEVYYPRGIVLDANGSLVVCDCKKKFLLQAY